MSLGVPAEMIRCGFYCVLSLLAGIAAGAPPRSDSSPPAEVQPKKGSDEAQKIAARGVDAFQKGDLAAAKKHFQKVLELVPDNRPTLINLGLLEYRLKNYDEAKRLITKVTRAEPDAALPWLILGQIEYDLNRLDAALAALAQAVLLEPKDPRAHHYLGVTIGKKGWYSGAEDEMRRAIELDPNYAEAHFNLALFYLQRVPPAVELARRHYQKAIDLGAAADEEIEKTLSAKPIETAPETNK